MNNPSAPIGYHFAPARGLFGDPIPFFWEGEYHVFFQNSPDGLAFDGMRWAHVVSRDLVHWARLPDALLPEPNSPDAYGCWTGSVLHYQGQFHIFYTGCGGPGGGRQSVCHATSHDLITWHKDPSNPRLLPRRPYAIDSSWPEPVAWRDPIVYQQPDGQFTMLLAADMPDAPHVLRGCIARLTSTDLVQWQTHEPLFFPGNAERCECPDYFPLGLHHVLLFSYMGTQVRVAQTPLGPWQQTGVSMLDDFRFYAAKTLLDAQGRRVCFGHLCNRFPPADGNAWEWGGIMALPRQLTVNTNGQPLMVPVAEVESLRRGRLPLDRQGTLLRSGLEDFSIGEDCVLAHKASHGVERALLLLGEHPAQAEFEVTFALEAEGDAGVLLGCDAALSRGYAVHIDRQQQMVSLSRLVPARLGEPLLLQHVPLPADIGSPVSVRVFLDRTVVEVFVGGRVCLSGRMYDRDAGPLCWGLYTDSPVLEATGIRAWHLDDAAG